MAINLFAQLYNSCDIMFLSFYYKFTDSTSTKQIKIASKNIVFIEGIFLQRQEWRSFFDFII